MCGVGDAQIIATALRRPAEEGRGGLAVAALIVVQVAGADVRFEICGRLPLAGDVGDEAAERLNIFVDTDDGFEIARADLRLRGMGNLFGEEQSGEATFRIADPIRDEDLNIKARAAAEMLLDRDPELTAKENAGIRKVMGARYSRALELFRVG